MVCIICAGKQQMTMDKNIISNGLNNMTFKVIANQILSISSSINIIQKSNEYSKISYSKISQKIKQNITNTNINILDSNNENKYYQTIRLFHISSNKMIINLNHKLNILRDNLKKVNELYGFDQNSKFSDVMMVFHSFRMRFRKSLQKYDRNKMIEKNK